MDALTQYSLMSALSGLVAQTDDCLETVDALLDLFVRFGERLGPEVAGLAAGYAVSLANARGRAEQLRLCLQQVEAARLELETSSVYLRQLRKLVQSSGKDDV